MPKYKVNRLYLSGKGNNKFFEGDIIDSRQIENIDEKILDKSIIPYNEDEKDGAQVEVTNEVLTETTVEVDVETTEEVETTETKETEKPLFTFEKDGAQVEVFSDSDIKKEEIVALLMPKGIPFNPADKKAVLFSILLDSLK